MRVIIIIIKSIDNYMVDASTRKHYSVSACRRVGGRNRCACLDKCKILLFYIKYALGILCICRAKGRTTDTA